MHEKDTENISLIYEFNQDSPLFARVAMDELNQGNLEKAKEILDNGMKIYPNYPTAYLIYGLTLANLADYENAREAVKKGATILGVPATEEFYLNKIEEIKNKNSLVEQTRRVSFIDEENTGEKNDDEFTSGNDELNESSENNDAKEVPLEDRLEELAKELENAKIEIPPEDEIVNESELSSGEENFISMEPDDSFLDETDLVSETMAMILEGQEKFKEAIKVYEKLKMQEPDKAEIFDIKIAELEKKISG